MDAPVAPWDVCIVSGTSSSMYTCGDDNAGYYVTYETTDCTGENVTGSINGTYSGGSYGAVCTASDDCSYTIFEGYKASNGTTCSNSAYGNFYSIPSITECVESGPVGSKMITCAASNGAMMLSVWDDNDDCSGTASSYTVMDSCLFSNLTDGECQLNDSGVEMTVKMVFVMVVASWTVMA